MQLFDNSLLASLCLSGSIKVRFRDLVVIVLGMTSQSKPNCQLNLVALLVDLETEGATIFSHEAR